MDDAQNMDLEKDDAGASAVADRTNLFTPVQVALGSFWGGPLAAIYFLHRNYSRLGMEDKAKQTLIWGSVFLAALLLVMAYLPEGFPSMVIPLAYCIAAKQITVSDQMKKEDIEVSEQYAPESGWVVFGIGTLALILFLPMAFGFLMTLESYGLVRL